MPKPTGSHTEMPASSEARLTGNERLNHPYFIPRECIVQPEKKSGYEPGYDCAREETLLNL